MNELKIYNEMMLHIPLCTHKNPKRILIISNDKDNIKNELENYKEEGMEFLIKDVEYLKSLNEKEIDVLILMKEEINEFLLANIRRILKNDGILIVDSLCSKNKIEKIKEDLILLGNKFNICMPYSFNNETIIFSSNKYHPISNIILQRSDLLNNIYYYSSEIHCSSFVYPKYFNKELLGIIKR